MTTRTVVLLALAQAVASPALAGEVRSEGATAPWFDWDRYHARQDACSEKDRIVAACARGYPGGLCDDLAFRQATRGCSPWGPLGDRR